MSKENPNNYSIDGSPVSFSKNLPQDEIEAFLLQSKKSIELIDYLDWLFELNNLGVGSFCSAASIAMVFGVEQSPQTELGMKEIRNRETLYEFEFKLEEENNWIFYQPVSFEHFIRLMKSDHCKGAIISGDFEVLGHVVGINNYIYPRFDEKDGDRVIIGFNRMFSVLDTRDNISPIFVCGDDGLKDYFENADKIELSEGKIWRCVEVFHSQD